MKKLSFRTRLTLYHTALLSAILLALGALFYPIMSNSIYSEVDKTLRLAANQASATLHFEMGIAAFEEGHEPDVTVSDLDSSGSGAVLLDKGAKIIDRLGAAELIPPAKSSQLAPGYSTFTTEHGEVRLYTLELPETGGWLQVGLSLKDAKATMARLVKTLILLLPVGIGLSAIGGLFLAGRALGPVDRITKTARDIGGHDLSRRLNLDIPPDEIGRLASTFDEMLDRLEAAFRRQREFTADAAHELRTPLAVMKGNIGVALNRERSCDEYVEALNKVEHEVDRLTHLVEELLMMARLDGGAASGETTTDTINLSDLISAVISQLHPLATQKGVEFSSEFPADLNTRGDSAQLIRMIYNLVDNAVRYTPTDGSITVTAAASSEHCEIRVSNSGPGIPSSDLPLVFERFYRGDRSRRRSGPGNGLGLAISQAIAFSHGGAIAVESAPEGQTTFTVTLPVAV